MSITSTSLSLPVFYLQCLLFQGGYFEILFDCFVERMSKKCPNYSITPGFCGLVDTTNGTYWIVARLGLFDEPIKSPSVKDTSRSDLIPQPHVMK